MVVAHPVSHSFSNGRGIPGYKLVFKCSGHRQLHIRFQIVATHHVARSFLMVDLHPVTHSFSNCWYTTGYTLNFKWSGNTRAFTYSLSKGRETSGYTLPFFVRDTRLHPHFQTVELNPVTYSFSSCRHIMLHIRFKMVGTHPVTYSFSNGWDTLGYTNSFSNGWWILGYVLVYKFPGHTQPFVPRLKSCATPSFTLVLKWSGHTR